MSWKFLAGIKVIAFFPKKTTGNLLIDLWLGEKEKSITRKLTPEEIEMCHNYGFLCFCDRGIGEHEGKLCQFISLSYSGKEEAYEKYIDNCLPSWLVTIRHKFIKLMAMLE